MGRILNLSILLADAFTHLSSVSFTQAQTQNWDECLHGPHNHISLTVLVNSLTFKHPDLWFGIKGEREGEGGRERERAR